MSPPPTLDRGKILAGISNAINGLHREYHGRGATRARTIWQGDYVCVFLEDLYTTVERTLIDAGHHETVRSTRFTWQTTMRDRFEMAIEELTQREVMAFFSQVHFAPDMALEGFVLKPEAGDRPSANGDGDLADAAMCDAAWALRASTNGFAT